MSEVYPLSNLCLLHLKFRDSEITFIPISQTSNELTKQQVYYITESINVQRKYIISSLHIKSFKIKMFRIKKWKEWKRKKEKTPSEEAPWQRTRPAFGRTQVQMPWPANLVEVFSSFLILKIAKELVISQRQCRVGPHIQLLLIQFTVYCFLRSETIVVKIVDF